MQFSKKSAEREGICRRCGDEMVMIREHCPGMKYPAKLSGAGEKRFDKVVAPLRSVEMGLFPVSAGRYYVSARLEESMLRSMRPVHVGPLECGGTTPLSLECADVSAL
jgi:hypothetical protein